MRKKRMNYNPTSREFGEKDPDLDHVAEVIREVGIKFAEEEEKRVIILLVGLIRKRSREEPETIQKLRELLRMREYLRKVANAR